MKALPYAVLFMLWLIPSAQALELEGSFTQGGLVTGRVAPGAKVYLDGKAVAVAPDGRFLFGFGREAEAAAELRAEGPDGTVTRRLEIARRDYDIQRVDGLPDRKVTPKPEDLARIRADQDRINAVRRQLTLASLFASGFQWPVTGRISGVYGSQRVLNGQPRRPHFGVDIAAPKGTPVAAMADGTVALVHQDMFYTGKTVMLDHGLGLTSVYIHMDAITVDQGAKVRKGQQIGTVGQTGRATGPHLHWGVAWFGTQLDPALLVGPQPN